MEVEAVDEGTIGKLLVAEGTEGVAVNAVIAVLLQEGESKGDIGEVKAAPKPEAPAANAPEPAKAKPETKTEPAPAKPVEPGATPAPSREGARVFSSPLARRLAKDAGIDISAIAGSGPHGRVVKTDIEKAQRDGVPTKAGAAMPAGLGAQAIMALFEEGTYERVPNDGMRKIVAQRLTEAKQTIPHFYVSMDCRIDAMLTAREQMNTAAPEDKDGKPSFKLSVNDFVIKAWAVALMNVPNANATWAGDSILYHAHADIGVAVAVPGGLFTPVVRQADTKPLRQISAEMKDFAGRARSKKLAPHEYQGGSSAVSNLGMYGVSHFAAVINPPHGTILAVGAGGERVFADQGEVKTGQFMTVTLT
jgi:pyruvate dehydrogenase E2 component (dihydrolipoamide acetyltransferase)